MTAFNEPVAPGGHHDPAPPDPETPMTPAQRNAFLGSFGGWAVDGFTLATFGLVLAPTLTDLLPRTGVEPTTANVGFYGQLGGAVFLLGWGCSFLWGPIADRFGRKPAMIGSILLFSLFTALAGLSTNVWQWMAFRFLCAVGIGGEWAMAGTVVAEAVPERLRVKLGGILHSANYIGQLATAVIYLAFGQLLGWRGLFLLGLVPALMVLFIRRNTEEPARWQAKSAQRQRQSLLAPMRAILSGEYRRRTIGNLLLLVVCVIGLWATATYVPTAVTDMAKRAGWEHSSITMLAGASAALSAIFTVVGCLCTPRLVDRLGRKGALALLFVLMMIGIIGLYAIAYPLGSITMVFAVLPILGFGGANFAVFTIWLPEQYPTSVRATAFAFTTTISRWFAAAGTFLLGFAIHAAGSLSLPLAATALAFVLGLLLLPLVPETRDSVLPD
ncbi:MFS transporter [Nocardia sp. NPDC020380]|uniref:MFS transporter n=1 Tax=Nocardia sp. NPDC020380 TaxID=3364309 RepID=UPI0037A1E71A